MEKQQQQQQYEELKWNNAPLFHNHYDTDLDVEDLDQPKIRLPLHAETTALLVVDVQPEYWSSCPSVRKDFPDFPDHLKRTVDICRERRAKIIWVRADYRRTHSPWLVQFERLRGKTPGFMVEAPCNRDSGDSTTHWEDFATPQGGEVIIPKTSWSSTSDTALTEVLRVSGVDTVLVCGLITSVCVQHSAFGVFEAGFRTLLVTDACADRGRARHEAALTLYGDYMYELVTSHDLQHAQKGLLMAKPVWLTLDRIGRASHGTGSSSVTGGNTVSPLGSCCDLQNVLPSALAPEKNGNKGLASLDADDKDNENETSTVVPSRTTISLVSEYTD
jgi:nicotinamidase-related amidase